MNTYKIKIVKKIFLSEENGFGVFKVMVKSPPMGEQIVVGNLFDVNEGDFLEIEGEFTSHPKFGNQIKVSHHHTILPEDHEGIIKYLSSGRFKGVGKKTAEKIVHRFGLSTFEILENQPEKVSEIRGIKKSVVAEIKKSREENKTIRDLMVHLSPHGIGSQTVFKIYKEFGESAREVLESDPYIMIERIKGIGFRIADTIARGFNVSPDSVSRIRAGIQFVLSQVEQKNGDLYTEEYLLLDHCTRLLEIDPEKISDVLESAINDNILARESIPEPVILNQKNLIIEKTIARRLYDLANPEYLQAKIAVDFEALSRKLAVELTEEQRRAVISAVNNPLTIITGGPGTGKTTIIKAISEIFIDNNKNVFIAAPTGRAAKRIEETSFFQASTIHRMLKINPETRSFVHNENNPLQADAIIIDESSMIDSFIFYSLLTAISRNTRLIIIGDKDQLPSVGPGNILRDMINADYFNTIYLRRNFRQTESSLIVENAYRINTGDSLVFKPYSEELDFVFIHVENESQALGKAIRILEYHKNDLVFNSPAMQILVPMYRGEAGIDNINRIIQQNFNPEPLLIKREKYAFKRWDKVMQLKNNYEKEIFNGEQGIIADYDSDGKKLMVDYEGYMVEYSADEMDELTLSYAVSVHKSQGSEYDMVVLILLPAHSIMLNREIFYTAVTRAKSKLFLVSDPVTIRRAVANCSPEERKTLLPMRLKEMFESGAIV